MLLGVASIMSVGIIDAYFIGQLGAQELAAVSFIFPITIALSSLGVGVIAGISSVVSRALGEDQPARAEQLGNLGMALAALFGCAIAALLYMVLGPLFQLMQADDELLPLIFAYMQPYALGFPLLLTQMGGNGVLRGQGNAKRASALLLAYSATNWVLDPVLIHGVGDFAGFGIAGAAYATIGGWAVGAVLAIILVQTSDIRINLACLTSANWASGVYALVKVGGPAALSNAINPIGLSVLTALLAQHGQAAVAGFGAAGRLQSFAIVPLLALSSSIGAIVGQNWGADKTDRAREALLKAFGFCLVYGLIIATILVVFRGFFGGLFSEDPEVLSALSRYLLIAAWGFAGYGMLIVANGAFNAIDKAPIALAQSSGRVGLVMVPAASLLGGWLAADAIYVAELLANIIGGVAGVTLCWAITRKTENAP